ncbi:MAG: hypothetical protein ACFE7E_04380 [Candidatus Hodarchaeota archaeon]
MTYFYQELSLKEGYEQSDAVHEYYPEGFQDPENGCLVSTYYR